MNAQEAGAAFPAAPSETNQSDLDRIEIGDTSGTVLEGTVALECTYCDSGSNAEADCLFVIMPDRARKLAGELIAEADRIDPPKPEGNEA